LRNAFENDPELADVPITTREALVDARLGQGKFRQSLISYWGGCALTGCVFHNLLIASHIVPWSDATNDERLDPFNGLLLTANLDRLFGGYHMAFADDGRAIISPRLDE